MDQTPPAPTPPHAPHGGGGRRIVREPDDRKIAGVCSGLADHLGIDVAVMRVTAVVLAIVTPAALIAYLVASVAIPERRPDQPRVRARRVHLGQVPHPLIAVGAVVAVAVLIDDAWWLDPFPAALALVGIGVWLVVQNRDEAVTYRPDPAYPAEPTDAAGPASPTGPTGAAEPPHTSGPAGPIDPAEPPYPADSAEPTVSHPPGPAAPTPPAAAGRRAATGPPVPPRPGRPGAAPDRWGDAVAARRPRRVHGRRGGRSRPRPARRRRRPAGHVVAGGRRRPAAPRGPP